MRLVRQNKGILIDSSVWGASFWVKIEIQFLSLSQPSLSRHPASPAQPTQPAALLPAARLPHRGGSGFLRCFWGFLLGFPVGSGPTLKKVASVPGPVFLRKNKAFSAPRCVWCGKIKYLNRFFVIKLFLYVKIRHFRLRGAFST